MNFSVFGLMSVITLISFCIYSSEQGCFTDTKSYQHSSAFFDEYYRNLICDNITNIVLEGLCSDSKCEKLTFLRSNVSIIPTNIFTKLSSLTTLNMADSGIEIVEIGAFSGLMKVESINLADNRIKNISRGIFNSLVHLKNLDLSRNLIDNIEENSFHGSHDIADLDLSFNRLENIPESLLKPLRLLEWFRISNNYLKSVDLCYEFSLLRTVNLENNRIEEFPKCPNESNNTNKLPASLKKLQLGGNNLSKLNVSLMENLQMLSVLDISNNNFSSFPPNSFGTFVHLESLKISGNKLNEINSAIFTNLTYLKSLHLRRNNISKLDNNSFENCLEVTDLDLSDNKINSLPVGLFQNTKKLQKLNISKNKLDFLDSGVFNDLNELSELNLSENSIEYLETHIFIPLEKLEILDVSHNDIRNIKISQIVRSCPQLSSIDLNFNRFTCKELGTMFLYYKKILKNGNTFNSQNIGGIACSKNEHSDEIDVQTNNSNDTNYIRNFHDFFERDFKKTNFYKFFQNFKSPNENMNLNESLSVVLQSINKLVYNTSNDLNNQTKKLMEYIEEQKKYNTINDNETLKFVKNTIKLLIDNENESRNETLEKLTETIQNIENERIKYKSLELKAPSTEKPKEKENEVILENLRVLSTETRNLNSIFYEIRFFIITVMLITLTVFGVKLYRKTNFGNVLLNRNNDDIQSHDLPILRS